jgi:hypothetical protein
MKKNNLTKLSAVTLCCLSMLFFISCKKNDAATSPNSFTWTYNGNNFTAYADSAIKSNFAGDAVIIPRKNADPALPNEKFVIILSSLGMGTFTFGIGTPSLSYTDDLGNTFYGSSGALYITSNKSDLVSGNFSATLTNTKIITGQFTSVPIKP